MKSSSGASSWNGQSASIRCGCNLECAIYTSRRGENAGRRFYRCPRYSTPLTCQFFRWVDDADHTTVDIKYQLTAIEERQTSRTEEQNKDLKLIRCHIKFLCIVMVIVVILLLFKK
ncbi:hypothetical protein AXF42_Ash003101 [Apostasia shenzhenica]|uniref:GRF-type domain-containing protein n=1 Tax=Apostasia shenzhenica TaxID=1088818 RepID=A0A2I0A885_9ASPA|nr:hypothetical protein AXF42_Ash003101 [Apostasia shenzhenica]